MDVYLFAVWFCVLRLSFYFNRSAELIHHQKKKKKSDDGDESLSDLLTFAHGRVADRVRQEAVDAGIFVDTDAAEEEIQLSATQQMKIEVSRNTGIMIIMREL